MTSSMVSNSAALARSCPPRAAPTSQSSSDGCGTAMSDAIEVDEVVDARNLMCPMPILAATKAMRRLQPGQVVKILATDKGAISDIPAWADDNDHELLSSGTENGVLVF